MTKRKTGHSGVWIFILADVQFTYTLFFLGFQEKYLGILEAFLLTKFNLWDLNFHLIIFQGNVY